MATYVQGDGVGYATATASATMQAISAELTVSAWIYSAGGTSEYAITRWDGAGNKRVWALQRHAFTVQGIRALFSGDGLFATEAKDYRVTDPLVPVGAWTHMAMRWNSGTLTLFQDGAEVVTVLTPEDDVFTTLFNTDTLLYLMSQNLGIGASADGYYDIRVYDRALTDTEIAYLESNPSVALLGTPHLVGHWRLDDEALLQDSSGQGQDFTGVGNSGWTYPEGAPFTFPASTSVATFLGSELFSVEDLRRIKFRRGAAADANLNLHYFNGGAYVGFEQVAVSTALLDVNDLTIPAVATHVEIQADTNNVRYTMDGSTSPSQSSGMLFLTA